MADNASVSDWLSSIGTVAAVVVALLGYWFAEWQKRRADRATDLGHALQIGFKITVLDADARHICGHLRDHTDPLEAHDSSLLWRRLQPELGMEATTGPELNSAEQNR